MQFFDVNIPYLESFPSNKALTAATSAALLSKKKTRLKLSVKAMEIGFSGVAYNRTMTGVVSDSDRCSISLFPLSSLLNLSPSLSSIASFHRLLLGVSSDAATFRQYTRLTVSVENSAQASALNSGNPILRTYDLVAVKPLNQNTFEQACQFSEVDLIAIDFSDKLPFRLKLPMVEAAITRGVHFEITYSGLIQDPEVRRQLISNAKMLVEWTRGKNLIVSSSASSVHELRGPNDVGNLLSLLGLPLERAKTAISKNCRFMIINAMRKKKFYKEGIRVEAMPSCGRSISNEPWVVDWGKWDPLSSGEGDLLLEDIAKPFSNVGEANKAVKAIDFTSIFDSKPSTGLHGTDNSFTFGDLLHKAGDCGNKDEITISSGTSATLFCSSALTKQPNNLESFQKSFSQDLNLPASSFDPKILEIDNMVSGPHSSMDEKVTTDKDAIEISYHSLMLGAGCEKSRSTALVQHHGMMHVDLEASPQVDYLSLPSSHVNSMIVESDGVVAGAKISMDVKVSTDADLAVTSDLHIDLSGEDILEEEGHQESQTRAAVLAESIADTDRMETCGNLTSGNSEAFNALVEEPQNNVDHIDLMTMPALYSCGNSELYHGDTTGVISDGPLFTDAFSLNEAMLQEQNLAQEQNLENNHSRANNLLANGTKPAGCEKVKRWVRVARPGFTFPFKHFLQVSFKRKATSKRKLREG